MLKRLVWRSETIHESGGGPEQWVEMIVDQVVASTRVEADPASLTMTTRTVVTIKVVYYERIMPQHHTGVKHGQWSR